MLSFSARLAASTWSGGTTHFVRMSIQEQGRLARQSLTSHYADPAHQHGRHLHLRQRLAHQGDLRADSPGAAGEHPTAGEQRHRSPYQAGRHLLERSYGLRARSAVPGHPDQQLSSIAPASRRGGGFRLLPKGHYDHHHSWRRTVTWRGCQRSHFNMRWFGPWTAHPSWG